jgi:uncharacterized protein YraI
MQKHSLVAALALFLAAPALPVAVSSTAAAQTVAYAESGTTNLRAGPGTNYAVIGKVRGGEQVLVQDSDRGWYFVSVRGQEGWMAGSRLAFAQARGPVVVQEPYVVRQPYYVPAPDPYYYRHRGYPGPVISFGFGFGDFDRDRRDRRGHRGWRHDRDWDEGDWRWRRHGGWRGRHRED